MRFFGTFIIAMLLGHWVNAQTINVSGQCMTGTITLAKISNINGKPAYQGTGTVQGFPGVIVSIYWLGAPDNVWVLDFDGQPYYQNSCNSTGPYGTGNGACPWTVVPSMSCTGGAALSIVGVGVLPVNLISFTAQKENKEVILNWKTASENNNKGFDVQRSKDGISWVSLGFVNGAINSSMEKEYAFNDKFPLSGKNYYRLAQQDLDGNKTYSSIVNLEFSSSGYYTLGNNPGNGVYKLNILSSQLFEITVLDLTGKKLLSTTAGAGIHQVDIRNYATGTYLLRLTKGNETFTEKLIKQ
jgi:hypothetical protein